MLRSSTLCHTDLSLTNFKRERDNQAKPMLDLKKSLYICVDRGALEDSIQYPVVFEEERSQIKNLKLGFLNL